MSPTDNIKDDKAIMDFLTSQNKGTQYTYKCFFKKIIEFTATKGLITGQQILDDKKADTDNHWEQWVITFKQWMKQQKTPKGNFYSDNAIKGAINTLRSFFNENRTPLIFTNTENRKLNGKAKRVTQDYELTNTSISKMALVGDLREKYIVLAGKSFGLRAGDFIALTYGTFRSIDLESEPPIPIGKIQTAKRGEDAYPFIDSDALPIIKAYLDSNKNKPNSEKVIAVQEEELSTIIQNLAKKADINLGDKHLRFHCFRKYLIDRLSPNMSESKWKQIIGKAISEDAYVSPLELRECYLKTMALTTVITNGNGKVSKISEELVKQNKITEALIQDSIKKDLELQKQTDQINEIKQQLENIKPLLDFLKEGEPKLSQILSDIKEGRYVHIETENAETTLIPTKATNEFLKYIKRTPEGEDYITLTPELIRKLGKHVKTTPEGNFIEFDDLIRIFSTETPDLPTQEKIDLEKKLGEIYEQIKDKEK